MDDRFKDQMMLLILNTMLHVDLMCNNLLLLGISKHQSIDYFFFFFPSAFLSTTWMPFHTVSKLVI